MKFNINYFLFHNRKKFVKLKQNLYNTDLTLDEKEQIQLHKFNLIWKNSYKNIPFYKHWKKIHNLPDKLSHISELKKFPIINKLVISENENLIFSNSIKSKISTGGSTGQPTLFPTSNSNLKDFYGNVYLGRSWWNLGIDDKKIHFWGHSHTFGQGYIGKLNELNRQFKDYLMNTVRLNAYNTSEQNIAEYSKVIQKYKPKYIIGYTSALLKLADYFNYNNLNNNNLKLDVIIPTAETISQNEILYLEKIFNCKVAIEYGMAETGVIAYSRYKSENIQVFWDSFICSLTNQCELIVTTLARDEFPLINYATGDIVDTENQKRFGVHTLKKIIGRTKDNYKIKVGKETYNISGIFIIHIIKSYKHISSVQVKIIENLKIQVFIVSKKNIQLDNLKKYFISQAKNDFPKIDSVNIEFIQLKEPIKSVSGKVNITII